VVITSAGFCFLFASLCLLKLLETGLGVRATIMGHK
jgi:hypothetical protein